MGVIERPSARNQNRAVVMDRCHRSTPPKITVVFVAGEGEWPKSYVIPSVVLSLTAAGFLIWHVIDPGRHVDAWAVILLIVGFLPWLRTVFESITFPGGGEVKYRELQQGQERQEEQIRALQFLIGNFLPESEQEHLRKFAAPEPFAFGSTPSHDLFNAIRQLRAVGFLEPIPENWAEQQFTPETDMKTFFRVTDHGQEYLEMRDKAGPPK